MGIKGLLGGGGACGVEGCGVRRGYGVMGSGRCEEQMGLQLRGMVGSVRVKCSARGVGSKRDCG